MGDEVRTFNLHEGRDDAAAKPSDAQTAKDMEELYKKLPSEWQGYIDRYARASVEHDLAERANKIVRWNGIANNEGKLIRALNSYATAPDGKPKNPNWITFDEDKDKKVMLEKAKAGATAFAYFMLNAERKSPSDDLVKEYLKLSKEDIAKEVAGFTGTALGKDAGGVKGIKTHIDGLINTMISQTKEFRKDTFQRMKDKIAEDKDDFLLTPAEKKDKQYDFSRPVSKAGSGQKMLDATLVQDLASAFKPADENSNRDLPNLKAAGRFWNPASSFSQSA